MKIILLLLVLCFSSTWASAQSEPTPVPSTPSAPPKNEWDGGEKPTPSLDVAKLRWWAPENAKDLRGIMVIIPGKNGDGRGSVDDPTWRAFAEKVRFALVGVQFQHATGDYQGDPNGNTSEILEKALEKLATDNGYPQLKSAPLAFWGHSAGSNTGERFAFRHPNRVVALASIKGTWGPGEYSNDKGDIPYLICTGATDRVEWVKSSCDYYAIGQDKKALWTQALHPTEGHDTGKTKDLAILFLTAAINARMEPLIEGAPPSLRLKNLSPNSGWLGDPKTLEIAAYTDYKGKKKEAVWLPNAEVAQAWKAYLKP